jgi:hypothetical protein
MNGVWKEFSNTPTESEEQSYAKKIELLAESVQELAYSELPAFSISQNRCSQLKHLGFVRKPSQGR